MGAPLVSRITAALPLSAPDTGGKPAHSGGAEDRRSRAPHNRGTRPVCRRVCRGGRARRIFSVAPVPSRSRYGCRRRRFRRPTLNVVARVSFCCSPHTCLRTSRAPGQKRPASVINPDTARRPRVHGGRRCRVPVRRPTPNTLGPWPANSKQSARNPSGRRSQTPRR